MNALVVLNTVSLQYVDSKAHTVGDLYTADLAMPEGKLYITKTEGTGRRLRNTLTSHLLLHCS